MPEKLASYWNERQHGQLDLYVDGRLRACVDYFAGSAVVFPHGGKDGVKIMDPTTIGVCISGIPALHANSCSGTLFNVMDPDALGQSAREFPAKIKPSRRPRRNHSPAFRAKVALAAIKGDRAVRLRHCGNADK